MIVGTLAASFSAALGAALRRLGRAMRWPLRDGGDGSETASARSNVGHYRIERELGRGSMGTVYLAHDRRTGRRVALKTLVLGRMAASGGRSAASDGKSGSGSGSGSNSDSGDRYSDTRVSSDDARTRFLSEVRAAARLSHPGIVAVHETGTVGDLGFIAMEYVAGADLTAHTVPGRLLPVSTVLRLLVQAARALAHAHREGVVHRDIKPANLLIDAESGDLKVADFGIARVSDAGAWRTRTGQVLGSPAFMSPEQMAGRPVDGRADLYALGVVLFLLLTGTLPHPQESMGRLLQAIAHEAAPDVRSLRPDLPEALAHIVALALEKRARLRYADGDQMADDLAAVLLQSQNSMAPQAPPS